MRRFLLLLACTGMVATHAGLTGTNGYAVQTLFRAADVTAPAVIAYEPGFAGARWEDLHDFHFGGYSPWPDGNKQADEIAIDDAGVQYLLVSGWKNTFQTPQATNTLYTGLLAYDASGVRHVHQREVSGAWAPGIEILGVTRSPVTAGRLTQDHLVLVQSSQASLTADVIVQIVDFDPATGNETLVHEWALPSNYINPHAVVRIDGAGNLYVLALHGDDPGPGNLEHETLQKLVWNGSGYDQTHLMDASTALELAADGNLYTFPRGTPWGVYGADYLVQRVDPATGNATLHTTLDPKGNYFRFNAWHQDSNGKFWIALKNGSIGDRITELVPGTMRPGKVKNKTIVTYTGTVRTLFDRGGGKLLATSSLSAKTYQLISPVAEPEPATITSTPVVSAFVGLPYSYAATADGAAPVTWSLLEAPAWLSMDTGTGELSGTPTAAGSFSVTILASNAYGFDAQAYTIDAVPLVITSNPVVDGVVGQPYAYSATADGAAPITWTLLQGPSWLSVDGGTGALSGTPTAAGFQAVDLEAANAYGSQVQQFEINVLTEPPQEGRAFDDFESGDFRGGSGWNGIWNGDLGDPGASVVGDGGPHSGAYHVRLRGTEKILRRNVDLGGATAARLKFQAKAEGYVGTDEAWVGFSAQGQPLTWYRLFTAANADGVYAFFDFDLAVVPLTDSFTIYFWVSNAAGAFYVDDVEVLEGAGPPPPPPPPQPETLALDDFESQGFSGGTGFAGAWTQSGDVKMRVNRNGPHSGAAHVRLRQSSGYLERGVDLTGATDVKLKVWVKVNSFEGSDQAHIKVSSDGVNYTTVKTFTAADSDNAYHLHELDLSAFAMTADFRIVFDAEMDAKKDRLYVDDVELEGVR